MFNEFLDANNFERPVLLLLHQQRTHGAYDNVKYAVDNKIIMLGLPAHCTHVVQPLDKFVFCSLKSKWAIACKDLMHCRGSIEAIGRNDINSLLSKVHNTLGPELAINGFRQWDYAL